MATLTIRNVPEATKRKLRTRAAANGRSMEEEARRILRAAVTNPGAEPSRPEKGLATAIAEIMDKFGGGFDLDIPRRTPFKPPRF